MNFICPQVFARGADGRNIFNWRGYVVKESRLEFTLA